MRHLARSWLGVALLVGCADPGAEPLAGAARAQAAGDLAGAAVLYRGACKRSPSLCPLAVRQLERLELAEAWKLIDAGDWPRAREAIDAAIASTDPGVKRAAEAMRRLSTLERGLLDLEQGRRWEEASASPEPDRALETIEALAHADVDVSPRAKAWLAQNRMWLLLARVKATCAAERGEGSCAEVARDLVRRFPVSPEAEEAAGLARDAYASILPRLEQAEPLLEQAARLRRERDQCRCSPHLPEDCQVCVKALDDRIAATLGPVVKTIASIHDPHFAKPLEARRSLAAEQGKYTPEARASGATGQDAASAPSAPAIRAPVREGSVIALSNAGDALVVADEDHRVLRWIPLDPRLPAATLDLPGAPAQVLVVGDRLLVTIRDPGLLLVVARDPAKGLVERARVALPADAWGVAVVPGKHLALVTSAWTHQVSAVDLVTATKRWSIDVPREPRAVVVGPDGVTAYVTHLVGPNLTRLSNLYGTTPKASVLPLPAAPHRAPPGRALGASLAYAAVLSSDGSRLFVPRHALGALGQNVWYGRPTVDVLRTEDDEPLAPPHDPAKLTAELATISRGYQAAASAPEPPARAMDEPDLIQPRGCAYLPSKPSLLVVAEGGDRLTELSVAPVDLTRAVRRSLPLGAECGAPSGVAVSADERTAYVLCRSTDSLATVRLEPLPPHTSAVQTRRLGDAPLPELAARGRRLFYDATEPAVSGGLGCAGCHPEGRDDGHTYYEADVGGGSGNFLGSPEAAEGTRPNSGGYPRQTPMLAGRVSAAGPYGWHAQDRDLVFRLRAGVELHRWQANVGGLAFDYRPRFDALIAFLRTGLVPPPRERRELTPVEQRGRALFLSPDTRCADCHTPATEYTDRATNPLRVLPAPAGFRAEENAAFKTPSLLYVGGTPPYFHDGSAATLERLVDDNDDRMGKTNQLSPEDRAALVAFLRTL